MATMAISSTPLFTERARLEVTQVEEQRVVHLLFFTLNREDFSFVIHLDRQPLTSRRREAQTGSRARSGSRSERTLDAVEHSRTLMEWWPFLIFHRGGLRIKVINNSTSMVIKSPATLARTEAQRGRSWPRHCLPRIWTLQGASGGTCQQLWDTRELHLVSLDYGGETREVGAIDINIDQDLVA